MGIRRVWNRIASKMGRTVGFGRGTAMVAKTLKGRQNIGLYPFVRGIRGSPAARVDDDIVRGAMTLSMPAEPALDRASALIAFRVPDNSNHALWRRTRHEPGGAV